MIHYYILVCIIDGLARQQRSYVGNEVATVLSCAIDVVY